MLYVKCFIINQKNEFVTFVNLTMGLAKLKVYSFYPDKAKNS